MNQNELDNLEKRIEKLTLPKSKLGSSLKLNEKIDSFSIAMDLVGGVIGGLIVGVICGNFFGHKTLCLIISMFLGIAAGGKLVWLGIKGKNNVS